MNKDIVTELGANHKEVGINAIVTDKIRKIVTTPAFMKSAKVEDFADIFYQIDKSVQEIVKMI